MPTSKRERKIRFDRDSRRVAGNFIGAIAADTAAIRNDCSGIAINSPGNNNIIIIDGTRADDDSTRILPIVPIAFHPLADETI